MTLTVNVIFAVDGSNIKDDVVKRLKEGTDAIEEVRTCSLCECLEDAHALGVNVLIVTPSMKSEVEKNAEKDFRLLFPNIDKSLMLVCDADSERHIASTLSRSVDYSKICQFQSGNAREWKYMMAPTIKQMASQEEEDPNIPDINKYVLWPKKIDSSVEEACVVFLDDVCPKQPVKIIIGDKEVLTSHLSRCVYVFSLQDIGPGLHDLKVTAEGEDYGCTKIEIKSDIYTLKDFFHKTIKRDPHQILSLLVGSNTVDKQDIERDLKEILQEKPINHAFLHLMERLLRLQPTDGSQKKDETYYYPSLLHFCAANGMSDVSEWLLYNTHDDKRNWRNSDGLTPAQLAEKGNYIDLQKLLDPNIPIAGPPVASRRGLISADSGDDETFLPSPLSPGYRRTSVPSNFQSTWSSDSGRSSFGSGTGGSDSALVNSFAKQTRLYDTIDDDTRSSHQPRLSKVQDKKYVFKKKTRTYSEIDDLELDSDVQLRPEKDSPYEEAWEKNPIPDMLPITPTAPQGRRPDSDQRPLPKSLSFPKGRQFKSKSMPRGGSLNEMTENIRL